MDQQLGKVVKKINLKVYCTVHSNPSSQVQNSLLESLEIIVNFAGDLVQRLREDI